jgi:hypothetical protein
LDGFAVREFRIEVNRLKNLDEGMVLTARVDVTLKSQNSLAECMEDFENSLKQSKKKGSTSTFPKKLK